MAAQHFTATGEKFDLEELKQQIHQAYSISMYIAEGGEQYASAACESVMGALLRAKEHLMLLKRVVDTPAAEENVTGTDTASRPWGLAECSDRFYRLFSLIATARRALEGHESDDEAQIDAAVALNEVATLAKEWGDRAATEDIRQAA